MEGDARTQHRRVSTRNRRPPIQPMRLHVPFSGRGDLGEIVAPAPVEITLEVTDRSGELAIWFDDWWWTEVLQRWAESRLTFQILPTAQALLHPVVLHHVNMVQRVAPLWRIIAQVYVDDVSTTESAAAIAQTRYHEVHFMERLGETNPTTNEMERLSVEELIAVIRREQLRLGAKQPILVRLPTEQEAKSRTEVVSDPVSI